MTNLSTSLRLTLYVKMLKLYAAWNDMTRAERDIARWVRTRQITEADAEWLREYVAGKADQSHVIKK
jgi:hypothetical protein